MTARDSNANICWKSDIRDIDPNIVDGRDKLCIIFDSLAVGWWPKLDRRDYIRSLLNRSFHQKIAKIIMNVTSVEEVNGSLKVHAKVEGT